MNLNLTSYLGPAPLDTDTFLTVLYVEIDDFRQREGLGEAPRRGPKPSLSRSEALCLSIFGQWGYFGSEREFFRYASRHLRAAFPGLGAYSPFNRAVQACRPELERVALGLAARGMAGPAFYEALDLTAAPTRNAKRRGVGWLYGEADIGYSNRLGWFEGFNVLVSCTPEGRITGFGFGPASDKDQLYAEHFLAARHEPALRAQWPSVGTVGTDFYVLDKGFAGRPRHRAWRQAWGGGCAVRPAGLPGGGALAQAVAAPSGLPAPDRRNGVGQVAAALVIAAWPPRPATCASPLPGCAPPKARSICCRSPWRRSPSPPHPSTSSSGP
ncbi:MAG: hypothetical protein JO015_14975, partial [Verrucomicrobia bacterium]|nr:hypothetical protein [Verrucomicrobiota bacterium]